MQTKKVRQVITVVFHITSLLPQETHWSRRHVWWVWATLQVTHYIAQDQGCRFLWCPSVYFSHYIRLYDQDTEEVCDGGLSWIYVCWIQTWWFIQWRIWTNWMTVMPVFITAVILFSYCFSYHEEFFFCVCHIYIWINMSK